MLFAYRLTAAGFLLLLLFYSTGELYSQTSKKGNVGVTLNVTDAGAWRAVQRGVEFRKLAMERLEPAYGLELKLLRLDSQFIVPRVLHAGQFQLKAASARMFAELAGAIAAINANYFDEKGRALAYLKTAEKEINRGVSKHALYTGIFGLSESGPFVTHRDEFQPAQAGEALQSGPLLLHRNAPVEVMTGLGRYARRSVIAMDKDGRLIVAVSDALIGGLSFAELQELFIQPKWQMNAVELLNLDGGGSAQLYLKAGKFEEWLPGTSDVPVAIGFFAKSN
jgi:Phosphodiester glycosidase